MPETLRKAVIAGVYQTVPERVSSRTDKELFIESVNGVLDDAGMSIKDVDGLIGTSPWDKDGPEKEIPPVAFAEYFGVPLRYFQEVHAGTQLAAAGVFHAMDAVAMGRANTVIVPSVVVRERRGGAGSRDQWEAPIGLTRTVQYAMYARRHMHEYGTTSAQLAQVAVIARKHAVLNPSAIMGSRGPITVEDVLNSRMIYDPLHLFDCCIVNDGGGAIIVTTEERARDSKHRPIHLLGYAHSYTYADIYQLPSLTSFSDGVSTGKAAFGMAGVHHSDIDVVQISDHFTIAPLIALEDIGFCKKGEGGPFVESGILELGGKMPMNTNGGYLSHSQSYLSSAVYNIAELVLQLRGEAGARQVPNARIGLYHGIAGLFNSAHTAILARD